MALRKLEKFPKLTIFRDDLTKAKKFTNLTIFRHTLTKSGTADFTILTAIAKFTNFTIFSSVFCGFHNVFPFVSNNK